ncbi:hypothetical protein PMAYCL1PPCAC_11709, partial [Pristionchus mayeri]
EREKEGQLRVNEKDEGEGNATTDLIGRLIEEQRLHRELAETHHISTLEEQLRIQQEEIAARDARIERLEKEVKGYADLDLFTLPKKEEQQRQKEMAKAEKTLARLQKLLDAAESEKETLEEVSRIQQEDLKERDGEVSRLTDEFAELTKEYAEFKRMNGEHKKKNEKLSTEVRKMRKIDVRLLTTDEEEMMRKIQDCCYFKAVLFIINLLLTWCIHVFPNQTWILPVQVVFNLFITSMFFAVAEEVYDKNRSGKIRTFLNVMAEFKKNTDSIDAKPPPAPKSKWTIKESVERVPQQSRRCHSTSALVSKTDVAVVEIRKADDGLFGFGLIGNVVSSVLEGGAAADDIVMGDQLLTINGVNVETLSDKKIKKILKKVQMVILEVKYSPEKLTELEEHEGLERLF